jgi:N-dimethylarginine dimethylaminohydrolase
MLSNRHLMCSPDHFTVAYVINPWMEGNVDDTVSCVAMQQWSALHAIVSQFTEVALLPPVAGLPDLVFTANAAVLRGRTAILSSFLHPERQAEEPRFRTWLAQDGFEVHELPRTIPFEGAGDALFDRARPLLWFGHGVRSRSDARPYLERLLGTAVQPLELARSHFYHLDTCFCPLEGGFLLYYPAAFHGDSLEAIESIVPSDQRLAGSRQDALDLACNAINVGPHVILNRASGELQSWLSERGFTVHETPTTEFLKAGGSAKCLSLSLNES